ncbi:glycoside hydrolase domain-containing protein [Dyella sp. C9]|uniref:glycoside hydrolase domain-containing protein n=1 Tax=Dyella sp. C9 TaxID=2202154 RepID=UPI00130033D0|nr:glycoside hydrolase domain-containing protein [Dyella sp. C9]
MGHRRGAWLIAGALLGTACFSHGQTLVSQQPLRWNADALGNHRYLVQVAQPADAVRVVIPWRRRDAHPEQVAVIVTGPDGQPVANVLRGAIDRASGELVFKAAHAGTYAVYYQPYVSKGRSNYPTVTYAPVSETADAAWAARWQRDAKAWSKLPVAKVLRYEAVDDFDAYTAMERTATPDELKTLLAAHAHQALLLFPETRANPIRMFDALPERWAQRGPGGSFSDSVARGEYLSFQVGAWAPQAAVGDVRVTFGALKAADGAVIPADAFTCFNLGGIDYAGKPVTSRIDVAAGKVQALWMGLDVPADAQPGVYRGELVVSAEGQAAQKIPLAITVESGQAIAHGDDDPSRLSRLRWLDSTLAQDNELVAPFTAITVDGAKLGILGRDIVLGGNGLPRQISSRFDERMTGMAGKAQQVLAEPMELASAATGGTQQLRADGDADAPAIVRDGPAKVHWRVDGHLGVLRSALVGTLEADGTLSYDIALTADQDVSLEDIRLDIPFDPATARYQLGLGRQGDRAPDTFDWKWNVENNQDGAWIGTVNAGLEFHLRDENYLRPLNTNFYHQQPLRMPVSWDNQGQGGIRLRHVDTHGQEDHPYYLAEAFSGPRRMKAGETLYYNLVMRVTPFKTIHPAEHFAERFYHRYGDLDAIKADGADVVNIHHATPINPWINYPFLEPDAMRAYVDAAHQRGMRVKIYDTVRELSDRAPELPMLESLGHEVISSGKGGGFSWLQEHLDGDYIAAWHVPENRDAAVINAGQSRWHNYYIEGLDWLARNIGIDGLYLDDVAYDRTTMKRVRKVLQAHRPHPLIDLHSASQYNPRDGYINSALLYMELFPYIDRLWFGEEFDYESTSPAYWLTEISGIPYGLMGEMLQHDGNPWRGMLFGMTNRLGWSPGSDPRALWKLWDAFGIEQAEMIGWWVHDTPVQTGRDDVLATSYVRRGSKTLIAIASWAPQKTSVKLAIDWKALGLSSNKATLVAPAVEGFQPAATFKPDQLIPLEPGKGWLIEVE